MNDAQRTTRYLALALAAPLGLLAAVLAKYALLLPLLVADLGDGHAALGRLFADEGILNLTRTVAAGFAVAALYLACTSLVAIAQQSGPSLRMLRAGYGLIYLVAMLYGFAVMRVTSLVYQGEIKFGGAAWKSVQLFMTRWQLLWPALAITAVTLVLHVISWRRQSLELYRHERHDSPAAGDRLLEDLRTHGREPRYRKSLYSSTLTHLMIIVIIPWLLQFIGCSDMYMVPEGSGNPVVALVQMVKPKPKKKKNYVLNENSAISFAVPDLDDSEVMKEVDQESQIPYVADTNVGGPMGVGGGKTGGWPEGMGRDPIRFIRVQHSGPGWDDGMDAFSRADLNFLESFEKVTKFKTASRSEAIRGHELRRFKKGYAPPFIFLTGDGGIGMSSSDIKQLRQYLFDGGMLVADAGSRSFDSSFRSFVQQVLPGNDLRQISDDDPIFKQPYNFPNGAPPLWHHGGTHAMGIKVKGRWAVFYHPGDMNDAWKTGHSGMSKRLAEQANFLGVNIIYYAFTHYLQETAKHRK